VANYYTYVHYFCGFSAGPVFGREWTLPGRSVGMIGKAGSSGSDWGESRETFGQHEVVALAGSIRLAGMGCRPGCMERAGYRAENLAMPFPFISTALGICFLLVWIFIGGMIFRDGRLAARGELDADAGSRPLTPPPAAWPQRPQRPRRSPRRQRMARANSG
jgi:hypothetical protein